MNDTPQRSDPRDYVLDLSSHTSPAAPASENSPDKTSRQPYLSIFFKCCNIYASIYRTGDAKAYAGHCPRCSRNVRVPIGPGGTTNRVFIAE